MDVERKFLYLDLDSLVLARTRVQIVKDVVFSDLVVDGSFIFGVGDRKSAQKHDRVKTHAFIVVIIDVFVGQVKPRLVCFFFLFFHGLFQLFFDSGGVASLTTHRGRGGGLRAWSHHLILTAVNG